MQDLRETIKNLLLEAVGEIAGSATLPEGFSVHLERPKREGQGDWASNVAMQLGKHMGKAPRELAQRIGAIISKDPIILACEVAGPGFLNITLANRWIGDALSHIIQSGDNYGRVDVGRGRKVQIEFVSANPTGPLHMGHGRGAAVGDIMSSIMSFGGWDVEREYYINDAGLQMENLGKSTRARYFELLGRGNEAPFPEDGYHGDYISDIAQAMLDARGAELADTPEADAVTIFTRFTEERVLEMIKKDLEQFGVRFNVWFSERSIYEGTQVQDTIEHLKKRGYTYEQDGAVWFRSTDLGDDKDRVLIRSNGAPTYFMSDIVYHKNKYDRGFDLLVNVWGADHHGYIPRVKSAIVAMGRAKDDLEIMLIQMVSLLRDGEPVAMSKRAGTFITLREVIDEVGTDATRFFFVMRRCDSHLDFDLELAKRSTSDNPVFYVQYAYARICSIIRESEARGLAPALLSDLDPELLSSPSEGALVTVLARLPEEVSRACASLTPHMIAYYATEVAEAFHAFYNAERIMGVDEPLRRSRMVLAEATRITLANALRLMGISAPERM